MTNPPRRTRFIGALKTAMLAARKTGVASKPELRREALMARVADETGLSDFGDDWFHAPYDRLVEAIEGEAQLNAAGEWAAMKQFEKMLRDRVWQRQWVARHPEIAARPLPHPVVIVGPMRSGTTRMQRLLACDERFNVLRSFETISPVPAPDFERGAHDPRITLARRIMRVARLANPRTLAIHPTGPMQPEEELGLLCSSFWGMKHEAQWHVPGYGRWCEARDATGAYRQLARLLQLVGWSQQSSSLRPWILKTPQHMIDLKALLNVFPDARIIVTHRDPLSVVGSSASLAWNQTCIYSDHADPHAIGREWLRKTGVQIERMRQGRKSLPASRVIDVHYDEMETDWRGTMARVYRFLDLDIEPVLPRMAAYQRRTRDGKRRVHRYSLAEWGLSAGRVREELGDYVSTYGIASDERRAARG
ncbi:sulfotransferase family protein [Tsuneonella sp. HG222]